MSIQVHKHHNSTVTMHTCWYCGLDVKHFDPYTHIDAPRIQEDVTSNGDPLYSWDGTVAEWPVCAPCATNLGVDCRSVEDPFDVM